MPFGNYLVFFQIHQDKYGLVTCDTRQEGHFAGNSE